MRNSFPTKLLRTAPFAATVFLGLSLSGLAWAESAAAPTLLKGPYLIYPGSPDEMTVLWQLDTTATCALAWGRDAQVDDGMTTVASYGPDRQYLHTITGLTSATRYFYRLDYGDAAYTTGSFRAAPSSDAASVRFLAYGDTRQGVAQHANLCRAMRSLFAAQPAYQSLLLHVGDLVNYGGSEIDWNTEYFNRAYADTTALQANIPVLGSVGNHEVPYALFRKYFPFPYAGGDAAYGSFDYGPAHIAVLNQYASLRNGYLYELGTEQIQWLENDLRASQKKWKFIVLHEPAWSAGFHPNHAETQARVQPLCERYRVSLVFAGHNHYYARAVVRGVHHITTGGGGTPLYAPAPNAPYIVTAASVFEFCKIAIDDDLLAFEAVTDAGETVDAFTLRYRPEEDRTRGTLIVR